MVAVTEMVTPKGKQGGLTPGKTPGSMKKNKIPGMTPVSMKKKNKSPGITPVSMKKKNKSPGITPVSIKKKNLSPGITPVSMKKNKSPGITPVVMKKKNKSPGITPVVMKKKQSPGITPVSMKMKNKSPGMTPVSMKKKQSPGMTPVSMKKKQSPGITPVSLKKKNKNLGKSPESLIKVQKKGKQANKLIESTLKVKQAVATQISSQKKQKPATHTPQSAGGDTVTPQKLSNGQMKKFKKGGGCSPVVTKKAAKRKLGGGEGDGAPAAIMGAKKLKVEASTVEKLKLITEWEAKRKQMREYKISLLAEENMSSNKFSIMFHHNRISLKSAANMHVMKVLEKAEDIIVPREWEVVCQDKEICKMLKTELKAVSQCTEFTIQPVYDHEVKMQKKQEWEVVCQDKEICKMLKTEIKAVPQCNENKMQNNQVYAVDIVDAKLSDLEESLPKGIQYNIMKWRFFGDHVNVGKVKYDTVEKTQEALAKKVVQVNGRQVPLVNTWSAMKWPIRQKMAIEKEERSATDKAANSMVTTVVENGIAEEEEKAAVEERSAADKAANGMVKTVVKNGTAEEEERAAVEEDKMEVTTDETEDKEKGDEVLDDELEEGEEEEDDDDDELEEDDDDELEEEDEDDE